MNEFSCQIHTLSQLEKTERTRLFDDFQSAVVNVTELDNGYAVTLAADRIDTSEIRQLIALERRCCDFLTFELNQMPLSVRITGREGVKAFLESEFKLK